MEIDDITESKDEKNENQQDNNNQENQANEKGDQSQKEKENDQMSVEAGLPDVEMKAALTGWSTLTKEALVVLLLHKLIETEEDIGHDVKVFKDRPALCFNGNGILLSRMWQAARSSCVLLMAQFLSFLSLSDPLNNLQ